MRIIVLVLIAFMFIQPMVISTHSMELRQQNTTIDEYNYPPTEYFNKFAFNHSRYWGGNASETISSIAYDSQGNLILAGYSRSLEIDLVDPYQSSNAGENDLLIIKQAPNGTVLWSTLLGGEDTEWVEDIVIDKNDHIILTGNTLSNYFPTKNALDSSYGGTGGSLYGDAFIVKFFSNGTLDFSTYLGGSHYDVGFGIDVDSQNNIVMTGFSRSLYYPTKNAFQDNKGGWSDVVVTKMSADGSTLLWSTYVGQSEFERGYDLTVNSNDDVIVTGYAEKGSYVYKDAIHTTADNETITNDAFITKFNATGSLMWSGFLGGSDDNEYGYSIETGINDELYITGTTSSEDFPIVNGHDSTYDISYSWSTTPDTFVAKLDANATELLWSTYVGDTGYDIVNQLFLDSNDSVYIVGDYDYGEFELKGNVAVNPSGDAIFLQKYNSNGTLQWSVEYGGSDDDWAGSITVSPIDTVLFSGTTYSSDIYAHTNNLNGTTDGFVVEMIQPDLDSDSDNITDIAELYYGSDPYLNDTDGDMLPDYFELKYDLNMTDPLDANADPDGDGLDNTEEYNLGTSPQELDTDTDGIPDNIEVYYGLNPLFDDASSDLDEDGMPNLWEYENGLNLSNSEDAQADPDNDDLVNVDEYEYDTDPQKADTDGDGITDGEEVVNGTDPTNSGDPAPEDEGSGKSEDTTTSATDDPEENDDLTLPLPFSMIGGIFVIPVISIIQKKFRQ